MLGGIRGAGQRREEAAAQGISDRGRPVRGRGESDRWGLIDRETRERRPTREGVIRKGKRISHEDATDTRAGWAGRDCFSLRGRRGRWAGWGRGRTGPKVGRAESKEK
jgi:hypothetical protein